MSNEVLSDNQALEKAEHLRLKPTLLHICHGSAQAAAHKHSKRLLML